MKYGTTATIKRIEVDEYKRITAVEFGEGTMVEDAMKFLIDYQISSKAHQLKEDGDLFVELPSRREESSATN